MITVNRLGRDYDSPKHISFIITTIRLHDILFLAHFVLMPSSLKICYPHPLAMKTRSGYLFVGLTHSDVPTTHNGAQSDLKTQNKWREHNALYHYLPHAHNNGSLFHTNIIIPLQNYDSQQHSYLPYFGDSPRYLLHFFKPNICKHEGCCTITKN